MSPLDQEKLLNTLANIANSLNRIATALEQRNHHTLALDPELPEDKDLLSSNEHVTQSHAPLPPHKRQKH